MNSVALTVYNNTSTSMRYLNWWTQTGWT